MTNRKIEYWVIPPEADAEFVAHMEEVLETYESEKGGIDAVAFSRDRKTLASVCSQEIWWWLRRASRLVPGCVK